MSEESLKAEKTKKRTRRISIGPFPAIPVRGLWDQANHEERQKAHRAAIAIMEYWLGYSTKSATAKILEVPPIRVWQMSQQATLGMLAALLSQPRMRPKKMIALLRDVDKETSSAMDPRRLLRKIQALERTIEIQTKLIEILREFPAQSDRSLPLHEQQSLNRYQDVISSIPTPKRATQTKSPGTGSKKRGRPPTKAKHPAVQNQTTTTLPPGGHHEGGGGSGESSGS